MPTSVPATPPTHGPEDASRNLGLDLMRATAILLVLVSHWANNIGYWFHVQAPHEVFFAGDVGVELFFALSGFLIGRILIGIADAQPTWRSYGIFMARRTMRTLPLYFLWLAVLLWFWPPRQDPMATALRFLTLTQNLVTPMPPDDYFAVSWSLTIEEWFYVLFGSGLILATRRLGGRGPALWLCLAAFLIVPLALRLAVFDWSARSWALNKVVVFRIDQIAYGVLMARLWLRGNWLFRHPWLPLAAGLALVGATWSGRLPVPPNLIPALMSGAVVLGCALCLPAALRLRRAPAWFAVPVRWVSTRSYALYIIHLTILVNLVQMQLWGPGVLSAPAAAVVAVVLPFLLAEASYRWLERPILRRRPRQVYGRAISARAPMTALPTEATRSIG